MTVAGDVVGGHRLELRFDDGSRVGYQLSPNGSLDALEDPAGARALARLILAGTPLQAGQGIVECCTLDGPTRIGVRPGRIRAVEAEQSNASFVIDETLILKVFKRLSPGLHPELELLRFLTERGFSNVPRLEGWYAYSGGPIDGTLGILQRFVAGGLDGWDLALDTMSDGTGGVLPKLRRLGEVTGELHTVLGSAEADPNFRPEEATAESIRLPAASVGEEIEPAFGDLPDDAVFDPIRGCGEQIRERLRLPADVGDAGRLIRSHGDFHLGQTLWADGDWVIIDFEGEPARPLAERRQKCSPLRDVAGMLRSLAYAASASRILRGIEPPQDWEELARSEFLAGYGSTVDASLLPSASAFRKLLAMFELEKAVYELRYELDNRPAWIGVPIAGIVRMLETAVTV